MGEVSVSFPKSSNGVYTVTNQTTNFSPNEKYSFDQYTGQIIAQNSWADIGFYDEIPTLVNGLSSGKFGTWNFVLILVTALALTF